MDDSEELKTLSKRKQRLSLGEVAKRKKEHEKETRKSTRTMLIRPDGIQWPRLADEMEAKLLDLIGGLTKLMKIPCRKVPLSEIRKVEVEKRSDFRREWVHQQLVKTGFLMSSYIELRSSIALGVNCVSKGLEANQLIGVIIEKSVNPAIITKLLVPIAEAKSVPILAVDGLNSTFKTSAGMRCIAFGLKHQCKESSHHFYPIFELIESEKLKLQETATEEPTSSKTPNSSTSKKRKSNSDYRTPKLRKLTL